MNLLWLALTALAACGVCALAYRIRHRRRRAQLPRTETDVWTDVDITRGCRALYQALDDHDQLWAIWPDADRAARIVETQHRLDQHRKGKEQ